MLSVGFVSSGALALLDQGGYMSRDLEVGTVAGTPPVQTIYATTQESPGTSDDDMILWAFCVDAACTDSSVRTARLRCAATTTPFATPA